MDDKNDKEETKTSKKGEGNSLRNLQKTHLEKLMTNPDKPVHIPERPEDWKPKEPPEFVRFYMGSSAGAGSEVFHVYRHLRRRENIRQQHIQESAEKEDLEMEFQERLARHRIEAEERTEKKRAKRLKKKFAKRNKGKGGSEKEDSVAGSVAGTGDQKNQQDQQIETAEPVEEEEAHFVIGGR